MHKSIPYRPSHSKKNLYINISNIVSEHKVIEFQNNYDTIQNSRCIKRVKIYFLQFCPRLTPHVYWCDQRTYLVYLAVVAVKRHLTPRSSVILALNTGGTCCIFLYLYVYLFELFSPNILAICVSKACDLKFVGFHLTWFCCYAVGFFFHSPPAIHTQHRENQPRCLVPAKSKQDYITVLCYVYVVNKRWPSRLYWSPYRAVADGLLSHSHKSETWHDK